MAGDGPVYRIGEQKAAMDLINVAGNLILEQFEKKLPSLHQLPPDVADFTGRQVDLKTANDFLREVAGGSGTAPTILAISGMPGVGKSALAIHAAHNSKDLFDEQLYVDLRGTGETGSKPLDSSDVLWSFLSSLGVDPGSIPEDIASRAGLFRSLLAEKGALLLLDNAHDEKQVRPLLPGNKRCAVLIASRPALSALEGALPIKLGLMPCEEALDLLAKTAGDSRVRAEADAARRIVELCGRLPLAIRIAGGKIRDKEHWSLAQYADLLENERKRLERLNLGDLDVRASFELSCRELVGIEVRIFRLLSLLPGQDFEPGVGGAMLEIDRNSAFEAAERLVDLRLIEPSSEGRYRFHDLMRLFAREKAKADETVEEREAARLRSVRWYVERSGFMDNLLTPDTRHKIAQDLACLDGKDPNDVSRSLFSEALGWFEREASNLLELVRWAYESGSWEAVYTITGNLVNFFDLRSMWADWVETHELALIAARKGGNKQAEAMTIGNMGNVYRQQSLWEDAIIMFEDCLKICRDNGDRHGESLSLGNLGSVYVQQGLWEDAVKMFNADLEICRNLGDKLGEAQTLGNMGIVYRRQGRWNDAIKKYEESLKIKRDLGDRQGESTTLMNIGSVYFYQGRWNEAIDMYEASLEISHQFGDRLGEGMILMNMGNVYHQQELLKEAIKMYKTSLEIFHDLGDKQSEGLTLINIGNVYHKQGLLDDAIKMYKASLEIFHDFGDRQNVGLALGNMGNVYLQQGLKEKSVSYWEEALQKLHPDSSEHKKLSEWLQSLIKS